MTNFSLARRFVEKLACHLLISTRRLVKENLSCSKLARVNGMSKEI